MTDLIERLHDHARNVGGDDSFERLYGSEANEAADEIAALRARVAEMRELLDIAVEDHDSSMGRSNAPLHWTNQARAILSKQEPEYSGWVEVVEEDRGR